MNLFTKNAAYNMFSKAQLLTIGIVAAMTISLSACDTPSAGVETKASPERAQVKTVANPAEQLFNKSCVSCHLSGVAGAPRKGDKAAWDALLQEKGIEALVESVKNGLNAMPPMGLCSSCSDKDFEDLIRWMSTSS